MRNLRLVLIGSIVCGLVVAEAASAQSLTTSQLPPPRPYDLAQNVQHERAPGVPRAPRLGDSSGALSPARPAREQHARNNPQPERDPPMPKPVPSIIAP